MATAGSATHVTTEQAIVEELRQRVTSGEPWFDVLLDAIAQWVSPEETTDERTYRYLIGGEAFDWLLLAERLCTEISDRIPQHEMEGLLFYGLTPNDINEEELRQAIGNAKYRAHLNYFYGILVEEALQLAIEDDLNKEKHGHVWANGQHPEDSVYTRLYGHTQEDLLTAFYRQRKSADAPLEISLSDVKDFTYWLFKYRLRRCDPARVASDTSRGLAMVEKMRARRNLPAMDEEIDYLDVDVEVSVHR